MVAKDETKTTIVRLYNHMESRKKNHAIPDALARSPLKDEEPENTETFEMPVAAIMIRNCVNQNYLKNFNIENIKKVVAVMTTR